MLIGVPIKPFGVAKARLAPVLGAEERSKLGRAVADHTITTARQAGFDVAVITADAGVAAWAMRHDAGVVDDPGEGLSAAATALTTAHPDRWAVVHADLPCIDPDDVLALVAAMPEGGPEGGVALAPAADGGTSAIAGSGSFPFRYGAGSFARHLASAAAIGPYEVVTRPGLALDLDTPADLEKARQLCSWL